MKFGTYIMAPEPISTAHFIKLSHQSVCLYVYPLPKVAMQRFGKHVSAATNTRNNRIVGRIVFCSVHAVSKESRRLFLPRTFSLSVKVTRCPRVVNYCNRRLDDCGDLTWNTLDVLDRHDWTAADVSSEPV
jgi:hypothetical protein